MAKILIVDDEAPIRRLLGEVLRRAGHEIVEAENGRKAIMAMQATTVDLVITDIMMPEQDGIETVMQVRKHHPAVRIIVISGGGHQQAMDYLPMAETLGADLTFSKPFKPSAVAEAVGQLLHNPGGKPEAVANDLASQTPAGRAAN